MALLATDVNDITLFKMQHMDDIIEKTRGYAEKHPQHTEYYESFITHLETIKRIYQEQLVYPEGEKPCLLPH